ncbi:hypothetical protein MAR_004023, partial [Mya arenaria]
KIKVEDNKVANEYLSPNGFIFKFSIFIFLLKVLSIHFKVFVSSSMETIVLILDDGWCSNANLETAGYKINTHGNVCLLQTKPFFKLIESRLGLDHVLNMHERFNILFNLWYSIFRCDRSADVAFLRCENAVAYKCWSKLEKQERDRELLAIIFSLHSFRSNLAGKRIIEKGSMRTELNRMALDIFSSFASHCISIKTCWIERERETEADELSRSDNYDIFGVTIELFEYINNWKGPHAID